MQLFLSHAADDARVAASLRQLIERCSFGRVSVWFSSDTSPTGGVTPGGPWFDQLVAKIGESVAFLGLITPNSAANLWLHYEAGCAAIKGLPIIPIVAGVSVNEVRLPLSLYNAYNVAQPDGLKSFLTRTYHTHGVPYDEAMLETPIQNTLREINSDLASSELNESEDIKVSERIIRLMDKRFMDLMETIAARGDQKIPTFSVSAKVRKNRKEVQRVTIDVSHDDSIQDVANALYFKIEKHVEPFTYLEQWVVRDATLGVNLIMRDFLAHVKAHAVLSPGHEYEIIILSRPYDPSGGDHQVLA